MRSHRNTRDHYLRGPHGHGRHRARRGAVGAAILALLDEQPMHGYELIGAMDERSGGRWKPSPGAVYPALERLEERGLIEPLPQDDDGKQRYQITDAGRRRVAERSDERPAPWDDHGLGRGGDLRRAVAELTGPARQIGRFGTPEQVAAAADAIKRTTAELYRLLAEGADGADADRDDDKSDDASHAD